MAKIVKSALMVVAAVAIVVAAPYIAAAIGTIAGAMGVTLSLAAVAGISTAVIGMGISLGLGALASAFRKTPNLNQAMADRLNTSVVPSAPRKIVFGRTAAGQDVRFFEGDLDLPSTKKDGYVQVIAMASHRISALREWHVEEELVWSNGSFVAKREGFSSSNPFRVVLEGAPGNGFAVGSGRYWTSSATFDGCAYYVPTWVLDQEKIWTSGIPQRLTAIVDGCPVYDPRRDSTRGGSGPHRMGQQATYQFYADGVEIGRNPALALLTYLIGWRINGKLVWGMGIPAHRIDLDNFRLYANVCEEAVATQGGSTVQRYTADGIFSTTDTHEAVISAITAAMGSCKLTDRGGQYCLVGGYDDTAGPKVAFDADDLVAPANGSSPYIWNNAPPSRERYNIVRGRFADPAALYQLVDWGEPIEQPPLADDIPRIMSLDLGMVSRPETCQRIAKQHLLREYKTPGVFSALFGPKAFAVQVGSVITLTLPKEGWNAKLFRVIEQAETHDLFFQMTLREESSEVYAWDREEKPLPPSIRPQGYDPSTTIAPTGLSLTSDSYSGVNEVNVSIVHVTWTPENSGRVSGIQIQSRPAGNDNWTNQASLFDPSAGAYDFTSNAPGVSVEVRARFRMISGVYSAWVTATVATAAVETIADWDNVRDPSGTRPENNADVTGNHTSKDTAAVGGRPSGTVIQQLDGKPDLAAVDAAIAAAKAATDARVDQANRDIVAAGQRITDARSEIVAERDRAVGAEGVLNERINSIMAEGGYDDSAVRALIKSEEQARIREDVALASRVDTVQSSYSKGVTANGDFRDGLAGWNSAGWTVVANGGGTGKMLRSAVGGAVQLTPAATAKIDLARSYRLHARFRIMGSVQSNYVGLQLFDAAGTHLGNVYTDVATVLLQPGSYTYAQIYEGVNPGLVSGFFTRGGKFSSNTAFAQPLMLANYADSGGPYAGGYVELESFWFEDVGEARKVDARVTSEVATLVSADQAIANRVNVTEAQFRGDTGSPLLSRIANTETAVTDGRFATAQRAGEIETSLNDARGRLSTVETATTDGRFATAQRAAALEARAGNAGGNFVPNSSLSTLDGWGSHPLVPGHSMSLNRAGDTWMIGGVENNLTLHSTTGHGPGIYGEAYSAPFAVQPGSTIQAYALVASHRSRGWVSVFFYNASGGDAGYAGEYMGNAASGGKDINGWERIGFQGAVVPGNAVFGRICFRQYDAVTTDGYAWFSRPFVTEVRPGTNTWATYSPGNDRTITSAANAKISSLETVTSNGTFATAARAEQIAAEVFTGPNRNAALSARVTNTETATTDGRFAAASRADSLEAQMNGVAGSNLLSRANSTAQVLADGALGAANSRMDVMESEYNGIGATVTQQAATIADVNYRTRAYIVSTAVAGNNRAQIAMYADSNMGAGVDIVGDVSISGNLIVSGSVKTGAIEANAVSNLRGVFNPGSIVLEYGASGQGVVIGMGVVSGAPVKVDVGVIIDSQYPPGWNGSEFNIGHVFGQLVRYANGNRTPIVTLIYNNDFYIDYPPGGQDVYYALEYNNYPPSSQGQLYASYQRLTAMEMKR